VAGEAGWLKDWPGSKPKRLGSASTGLEPVSEKPFSALEKPFSVSKQPFSDLEKPFAVSEQPFSAFGKPFSVSEEPFSDFGKPFFVPEQPVSVSGKPFFVSERPFSVMEKGFGMGISCRWVAVFARCRAVSSDLGGISGRA
jgi:hypothetical protein